MFYSTQYTLMYIFSIFRIRPVITVCFCNFLVFMTKMNEHCVYPDAIERRSWKQNFYLAIFSCFLLFVLLLQVASVSATFISIPKINLYFYLVRLFSYRLHGSSQGYTAASLKGMEEGIQWIVLCFIVLFFFCTISLQY